MTDTTSEAWRAECEARWCLNHTGQDRQAYYSLVMEKRGKDAANKLIADVNAMRRAESSTSSS